VFELVHHVADVRLRVTAATLEELFRDAVRGLFAVMHAQAGEAQPVTRRIVVEDSADRTALLVDFLNEVLQRAHVAHECFGEARFLRLDETNAEAELSGVAPAEFEEDVKAVTYHEADVRHENGVWTTMLVLDI
jgi:SHS2 domain-containing protein